MAVKRALLGGLFAGIVAFLFYLLTNNYLFSWVFQIVPADVWKMAPTGWLWYVLFLLIVLLQGEIFAFVYAVLEVSMPGIRLSKGIMFGGAVWLVSSLPLALMQFMTTKLAPFVVTYMLLSSLVLYVLMGIVIAETFTLNAEERHP
jgi:hypothetical protein